tara:strand:+ start:76 stop:270 length:195 start_codon:yes stop_codon:yes gene_type:complete
MKIISGLIGGSIVLYYQWSYFSLSTSMQEFLGYWGIMNTFFPLYYIGWGLLSYSFFIDDEYSEY